MAAVLSSSSSSESDSGHRRWLHKTDADSNSRRKQITVGSSVAMVADDVFLPNPKAKTVPVMGQQQQCQSSLGVIRSNKRALSTRCNNMTPVADSSKRLCTSTATAAAADAGGGVGGGQENLWTTTSDRSLHDWGPWIGRPVSTSRSRPMTPYNSPHPSAVLANAARVSLGHGAGSSSNRGRSRNRRKVTQRCHSFNAGPAMHHRLPYHRW